jgi:type II secretory pathway pseudopilin PulG
MNRRAFTLIEASLATLVVGVVLVASINAVGATAKQRAALHDQSVAIGIAEARIAAIVALAYADPDTPSAPLGTDAGEVSMADWDDVDDAHDPNSIQPSSARDWTWLTTVEWVELSAAGRPGGVSPTDTGLKRIQVSVKSGQKVLAVRWAYRSRGWDEVLP